MENAIRRPQEYHNQYTNGDFDRIANVKRILEARSPEFEYVNGFTSMDGYVNVRCKTCGEIVSKSMTSLRKITPTGKKCPECERRAKEQKRTEKSAEVVRKEFKRVADRLAGKQSAMRICKHCGSVYMGTGKYCSQECAQAVTNKRYAMKKERRRKAAWTKDSASITIPAVYKRDRGVCWLCGGLCNINADPNDNEYPSLDHVTPISKGGMDTWDNVRLAHRWCNSVKSDKNVTQIAPTSK